MSADIFGEGWVAGVASCCLFFRTLLDILTVSPVQYSEEGKVEDGEGGVYRSVPDNTSHGIAAGLSRVRFLTFHFFRRVGFCFQ